MPDHPDLVRAGVVRLGLGSPGTDSTGVHRSFADIADGRVFSGVVLG
jgi:hypothetical protein